MRVIHYGADVFKPKMLKPVKNARWVKPQGGLWTSPINSEYGWRDFCISEAFREETLAKSFELDIITDKLYIIDSYEDLLKAPKYEGFTYVEYIDFEKLSEDYDGIYLTWNGQIKTRHSKKGHYISLYGWDVETILLFNTNPIINYAKHTERFSNDGTRC